MDAVDALAQAPRATADKLLELPLIASFEPQQETTMRAWLVHLGEPNAELDTGHPPTFERWTCNPLLPPLTPQASAQQLPLTPQGSKRCSSPLFSVRCTARRREDVEVLANDDHCRLPIRFLSESSLEQTANVARFLSSQSSLDLCPAEDENDAGSSEVPRKKAKASVSAPAAKLP